MRVAVIGTGYVGLVTGALFAQRGNVVTCVDINPAIVEKLNAGKIHIFEPGLEEIVAKAVSRKNLSFTTQISEAVESADIIFLAVGTPSEEDGSFNLKYLDAAAKDVGVALSKASGFKVVVGKSTVPQGTSEILINTINQEVKDNPNVEWAYVANPETLAEGTAVRDFASPDRIIIGTHSDKAYAVMQELYHPFMIKNDRLMRGSPADAELAKLFSNTALATRIAMVNEFARVADITKSADVDVIRRMVCSDNRIGFSFMFPSPGYGGSCFPKDVQGLVHQSKVDGYDPILLKTIHQSNEAHKSYIARHIEELLKKPDAKIAVWGLTFKPKTDDMRDAASIPIITHLLNKGASVTAFDPQDEKARQVFGDKITYTDSGFKAAQDADALILLTEWSHFDAPDFKRLKEVMAGNVLFDMRNRWLPAAANRAGFDYFGIGRSYPLK